MVPDITILGRILGGGFPVGALAGSRDVFAHFDHRKFPARADRAFHGGTFSANPATMCAGLETLRRLRDGGIYLDLAALGEQARQGLESIFARAGVPAAVTGLASTFAVHFRDTASARCVAGSRQQRRHGSAVPRVHARQGHRLPDA